jgi:hypothetical protein
MDYDAILAKVLALLQRETSEPCWGALSKHRDKGSPVGHIPTMPDVT